MKKKAINGRWVIWTTDAIEEWDGLTGDPALDSGWEAARMRSMQRNLCYGDVLYDVGTEHGALSVVIGREFVGAENMVLIEPSPEFWPNIRKHWDHNGLAQPAGFWPGFADSTSNFPDDVAAPFDWPADADQSRPETPGLAYRSLKDPKDIYSIRLDELAAWVGRHPKALNIDVEGAELRVLMGADALLRHPASDLTYVWVSIHPDLMGRFGAAPTDLHAFMLKCGWMGEHLGTDHEEHWLFKKVA